MGGRTSQLQIRVSPAQKAALKRLASAAGQNVSAYVLARALPGSGGELTRILESLAGPGDARSAINSLAKLLFRLEPEELRASLEGASVEGLTPTAQNRVAGLVEEASKLRAIPPPEWATAVRPLARPHFRWPLASLRPHQMRRTRVAYKRRNLFDPYLPAPSSFLPSAKGASPDVAALAEHLAELELDVEFYLLGGALLTQTFPARSTTCRPAELLRGRGEEADPIESFAAARGWPEGRVAEVVRATPGGFLDIPHCAALEAPPAYALAMKVACLRPSPSARDLDDLRFLLRSLNITSPEGAQAWISRYVAERHQPSHAAETLRDLLSG